NNIVLLTTLEGINGGNLNFLVQLLLERAIGLHRRNNVRALSFVRGNDTNLRRPNTGFEKARDNLFASSRLSPVEIRGTTSRDLLISDITPEHHRCIGNRPWKVDISSQTILNSDTVLQTAFIKHAARELRQARVHTVLNL